ncbi:MAG: hypothetical protein NTV68_16600 [Methanomicrobiales archaeon]|jgi:hypothetical protein|nr:hypothetical protein [Methanomicrobiales archaeon]
MATQAEEGEGMIEGKSTLTLAEAMVMAREKSELGKRHARYKRYYDSHPGAMQKKNRDYYQEHRDTIRARCRLSSERRGLNTVTGFVHHHPIFDQNPGSSADRKCTMHDSGNTAWQCEHL